MEYIPDRWCVVKISQVKVINGLPQVAESHYRVFASWSGGYLDSDRWKLNSGITRVEEEGDCLLFSGSSGSVYKCRKTAYGYTGYGIGVLTNLIESYRKDGVVIEELKEGVDFLTLDYGN